MPKCCATPFCSWTAACPRRSFPRCSAAVVERRTEWMKDEKDAVEQEEIVLDMLDRFLEKEVAPHVRKLEHEDIYPEEIVEKMKEMGLFGCIIAEEYGGLGMATTTYARVIERMSRTW